MLDVARRLHDLALVDERDRTEEGHADDVFDLLAALHGPVDVLDEEREPDADDEPHQDRRGQVHGEERADRLLDRARAVDELLKIRARWNSGGARGPHQQHRHDPNR